MTLSRGSNTSQVVVGREVGRGRRRRRRRRRRRPPSPFLLRWRHVVGSYYPIVVR